MQLGLGGTYGHKFVNTSLDKLVWWYGVLQRDVVQGDHMGICIIGGKMEHTMIV